ncbi:MAG: methyltransferase [Candidatus Omnitrophota bacterium]
MNKKLFFNILLLILIQMLILITHTWAFGAGKNFAYKNSDLLSPAMQLNANNFSEIFKNIQISLTRQNRNKPLFDKIKFPKLNSTVEVFLDDLKLEIIKQKNPIANNIPVNIGNTELVKEIIPGLNNEFEAFLIRNSDNYPLALKIKLMHYRRTFLINLVEITAMDLDPEQLPKLKKQLDNSLIFDEGVSIFLIKPVSLKNWNIGIDKLPYVSAVYYPINKATEILIKSVLERVNSQDKILEIGSGAGFLSGIIAKKTGANAVAIDYKKTAITNTRMVVNALGVEDKVEVINSNLFANLKGRKFSAMAFFPPGETIFPKFNQRRGVSEIENSYEFFNKLFSEFNMYLTPNGVLYMVVLKGSDYIYDLFKKYNLITEKINSYESEGWDNFDIFAIKAQNSMLDFNVLFEQIKPALPIEAQESNLFINKGIIEQAI